MGEYCTHWVGPKPTCCVLEGSKIDRWIDLLARSDRFQWSLLLLWHSWASTFRHIVSQSGSGAFRYRTWSSYSGTGLVLASVFLFIPVPDWLDAGQSVIPALIKKSTPYTSTLQTEGSGKWYTLHLHRRLVPVLLELYVPRAQKIEGQVRPDCSFAPTQRPCCLRFAPVLKGRELATRRYPRWLANPNEEFGKIGVWSL